MNKKRSRIILILLFVILFLGSRLPRLGSDEINPDGVNWHFRSQQFVVGLKNFQFEKTYQHYHPGVTLMWLSGVPIELAKQITGINTYNQDNFYMFNLVAKVSLVFAQLLLSLLALWLLNKEIGFYKSFFVISMLSMEPFFLGNSRLYHMDVLLALFMFIGILFAYRSLESPKWINYIFTGFFIGMSFLTKSIGIGALVFVMLYGSFYYLTKKLFKEALLFNVKILGFTLITVFIFFPALWVKPIYYLSLIFKESERIGIRKGHEQVIFGETTMDAGPGFYPLILLMKTTFALWIGTILYIISKITSVSKFLKNKLNSFYSFEFFVSIFYLGYLVVMTFPTKKLDRYMIPIYPFLAVLGVFGFSWLYKTYFSNIKTWKIFFVAISFLVLSSYIFPLFDYFPYYFTYTNQAFGTPQNANNIVAQKSFGIGMFSLKDKIVKKYPNIPKLGFYDIKPMSEIYANSKLFDIRDYGPGSYDLLVLGINEDMPDKILDSNAKFTQVDSLYINGLEFWRIYEKQRN